MINQKEEGTEKERTRDRERERERGKRYFLTRTQENSFAPSLSPFLFAERKNNNSISIFCSFLCAPYVFRFALATLYYFDCYTIGWQDIRRLLTTNDFWCTQMSRPTPLPPTRTRLLWLSLMIVASSFRQPSGICIQDWSFRTTGRLFCFSFSPSSVSSAICSFVWQLQPNVVYKVGQIGFSFR